MKTTKTQSCLVLAVMFLIPLFLLQACGSEPGNTEIKITFHDKLPNDKTVTRIDLKVIETQIIDINDNKTTISKEPQSFNLLDVTSNNPVILAHTRVSPGLYKQIRIILDENSTISFADGTKQPLKVPSGEVSGLKIDGIFEIPQGSFYTLNIDLDPEKSIKGG